MNIIIIGATSGIGKALFEKYAADGNRIGIVGRRTLLLDELRQQHPECTNTATADITKQDEVERGLRGEPMAPAYSATKAYQINYMEALRKKAFKAGGKVIVTDIRPGLVNTAMAKGEGLFWVMPVEKVASQICTSIRKRKSKVYVTKRWHVLAIINKNLPFTLYKRM